MKSHKEEMLAQKYAMAFVNCYGGQLGDEFLEKSKDTYEKLYAHHFVWSALDLVHPSLAQQDTLISIIVSWLSLGPLIKPLIVLLVKERRLSLVPTVIKKIRETLLTMRKEIELVVESSSVLSPEQRAAATQFFAHKTGLHPRTTYYINKDLIAGIRLVSDTFLWEHSLQGRLRALERALLH